MKTENERQEKNAIESVEVSQMLEMAIMLLLLREIKITLEKSENKSQSIANIRKGTEEEVKKYLPLLLASANTVLTKNNKQVLSNLKGKKPKISNEQLKNTKDYFKKFIKTKGTNFVVGKGQKLPQFFTFCIEKEIKGVVDGTFSIQEAISRVIKELADTGLSVIDYESGIKRNIDVFVRQQLLYAQKESAQEIRNNFAYENGITIFEFDAHPNARPSHQKWQGKRYDITGKEYPTLFQLTHGEEKDYGCKHRSYPVWNKEDKYMFTKEELESINTKPFVFNGKEYDGYSATQKQRLYERQIRALKRQKQLNEEFDIDNTKNNFKLKMKQKEYREFCKKMGTYPRSDRTSIANFKTP